MDQKTFEELLKDGDIDLILMDGGSHLTKEQMSRVREVAKQQSQERLLEMAQQLAMTPGYRDFIMMPLIGSIMAGRRKPVQEPSSEPKEEKQETPSAKKVSKDPNFTKVSAGVARPLKAEDTQADLLGKIYNFMRMDYATYLKGMRADKKYNAKLESIKEDRNKELIDLFSGKKTEKQKKDLLKQKKEVDKKTKEVEKPAKKPSESEVKTKAKTKAKTEAKTETKTTSKAETKAETKTAAKTETKAPETKQVEKPKVEEPKTQPKVEEPKTQPKVEEPKTQPKVEEPKTQPKVEEVPTAKKAPEIPKPKPTAEKIPSVSTVGKGLVGAAAVLASSLASAGISEKGQANIIAQIQSESNFVPKSENLNYSSAKRIQKIFGKNRFPDVASAEKYVGNPEALANYVYAKTDGNSEPGDGWKYRARGYLQHTGKNQYKAIAKYTGVDVVNNPDLLNDPEVASKAVPWFFLVYKNYKKKGPELLENIDEVNKAVGFSDKDESYKRELLARQIGDKLSSSSIENKDLKKQPASGGVNVAVLNNNNTVVNGSSVYQSPDVPSTSVINRQYKS